MEYEYRAFGSTVIRGLVEYVADDSSFGTGAVDEIVGYVDALVRDFDMWAFRETGVRDWEIVSHDVMVMKLRVVVTIIARRPRPASPER